MVYLENARAATRFWLIATAFNVAVIVTQKSTTCLQEDNYHKVPCDFENGLCGWTNLNPDATWRYIRSCVNQGQWFWIQCNIGVHYLKLEMNQLEENENSTLISPSLAARTNVKCQLSFLYSCICDNDACQLSVERKTHTGVEQLWKVTTYSADVATAHVDVPCSDNEYKILIVGKKVGNNGTHYLSIDNIEFVLTTLPTTGGSTFSTLPRRVSLTSFHTTLDTTSARSASTDAEASVPADRQTEDDEGLGTGTIVAIVVVVVVAVVVLVVLTAIIVVRRRNGARNKQRAPGPGRGASQAVTNAGYRPEQANPARSSQSTDLYLTPVNRRGGSTNQNSVDIRDDLRTTQPNQYEPLSHRTDENRPYEALNTQRNIYETPTNDNGDDKPYDTLFASTRDSDGYELPVSKTNLGKLRKQNDYNS